jgi:hypothetical protein
MTTRFNILPLQYITDSPRPPPNLEVTLTTRAFCNCENGLEILIESHTCDNRVREDNTRVSPHHLTITQPPPNIATHSPKILQ